jgi:hypothetical protein
MPAAKITNSVRFFNSLDELFTYCDAEPVIDAKCSSRKTGDKSWNGTETYADAIALARTGWTEMRPNVDRILTDVDAKVRTMVLDRPSMRFDVTGAFIDMATCLSGDPECFVEIIEEPMPVHGRVARLLIQGSASWSVDAEMIQARGAAVCALADALARSGIYLEVWQEFTITHKTKGKQKNTKDATGICLKRASDPLDIDLLMFPLGHPSMFRRLIFDVWERSMTPAQRKRYAVGGDTDDYYGIPTSNVLGQSIGADIELKNAPTRSSPECNDPARWVTSICEQFGIEVTGDGQ